MANESTKNSIINGSTLRFIQFHNEGATYNVESNADFIKEQAEDSAEAFSTIARENNFLRYTRAVEELVQRHIAEHKGEPLVPEEIVRSARETAGIDPA